MGSGCWMWWNPGPCWGGMVSQVLLISLSLFLEALSCPHVTLYWCLSLRVSPPPPPRCCVSPSSGLVLTLVSAPAFLVSVSPTSLSPVSVSCSSVSGVACPRSPPACSDQHSARACLSCVQRHHVPHAGPPGHEGLGAALGGPPLPAQGGAQPFLPREASCHWRSKQPRHGEGPRNGAPRPRLLPPAPPPGRP